MLQAASQMNDWEGSLKLLARLARVDVDAYVYAIAACGRANQPKQAQELLDRLSGAGLTPPGRAYNQVISSYARSGQWQAALLLAGDSHASSEMELSCSWSSSASVFARSASAAAAISSTCEG